MSFTIFEQNGVPANVQVASALVLILGWFAAVFSVPLCLVGTFVGPQILIPGVILAVMAAAFFASMEGLRKRRGWARWLLIALSSFGTLALAIALIQGSMTGEADAVGLTIYSIILIMFALIAWTLLTRSASAWFGLKNPGKPRGPFGTDILDD